MTTVCVNFLTYSPEIDHARSKYAQQCLRSLLKNLSFNEGTLLWHIADDGSPEEHINILANMVKEVTGRVTISVSDHMGYGGNMNMSTQTIHLMADIIMPIEEDWELVKRLDISGLVRAIEKSQEIQCIRLGYLGWTNELKGKVIQSANQSFLLFDPESTEVHVFAGHPRLETVQFERNIGEWPVGVKAGFTEMDVCKRKESRVGVVWPLDADINASQDYCSMFAHVGDLSV